MPVWASAPDGLRDLGRRYECRAFQAINDQDSGEICCTETAPPTWDRMQEVTRVQRASVAVNPYFSLSQWGLVPSHRGRYLPNTGGALNRIMGSAQF